MAKYIKDFIGMTTDGKLVARVAAIGPIELNKNQKEFRKVTFSFPATGQTITEGIFEFNFKRSLTGLKQGDDVEMKMDGDWPAFKILEKDGSTQTQTNQQMVSNERVITPIIQQQDSAKELKDIQICLQGYSQAYIIQGKSGAEALRLAEEDRMRLIKRSIEIRSGIGPMTHSPAQVEIVDKLFGNDSKGDTDNFGNMSYEDTLR